MEPLESDPHHRRWLVGALAVALAALVAGYFLQRGERQQGERYRSGSMMGQDQDDQIIAPYTTVMRQLQGSSRIGLIFVSAVSAEQVAEAQRQIESLLRQRHRLQPDQDNDFTVRSQEEIASSAAQMSTRSSPWARSRWRSSSRA